MSFIRFGGEQLLMLYLNSQIQTEFKDLRANIVPLKY